MGYTLQIVGICYYRGYVGKEYPHYCLKRKGNMCWEAYKKGREDKKKGICQMSEEDIEKYNKRKY